MVRTRGIPLLSNNVFKNKQQQAPAPLNHAGLSQGAHSTEKDILEKVIDPGEDVHRDPWNTPVFQIMSKPVISVNPSLRIKYALRLMKRSNIRRLTVMENNKILGLLNMTDVLHAVEELPVHDDHVAL